ncbi:MAG TPA: RCC1 domain-containing protein [Archangium sp.]|nr:RCC1 domain-containing protein [Archangium sp.]HYO58536.1 RCC1 domain-containing protein [Archangium sp.]
MRLKEDNTLWTWGYNYYGQLGDRTVTHRSTPVPPHHHHLKELKRTKKNLEPARGFAADVQIGSPLCRSVRDRGGTTHTHGALAARAPDG